MSEPEAAKSRGLFDQWLSRLRAGVLGLRWPARRRRSRSAEGHIKTGAAQTAGDPPPPPGPDISLTASELGAVAKAPRAPAATPTKKKAGAKRPAPKRKAAPKG